MAVFSRMQDFGFEIIVGPAEEVGNHELFGVLLQNPGTTGQVRDLSSLIESIHQQKANIRNSPIPFPGPNSVQKSIGSGIRPNC